MGGSSVRFSFLGQVAVHGADGQQDIHGALPALLLAFLVLEHPRPITRPHLLDLLWDGHPPPSPGAVRQVVARARAPLTAAGAGPMPLVSADGVVRLSGPAPESDVGALLAAVAEADAALERGDPHEAWSLASSSMAAAGLPLLAPCDGPWVAQWRAKVATALQRARAVASAAAVAVGRPADGVVAALEALDADPLDEEATRLLMAAHAAAGERAAALGAYERCRRHLDRHLGVRPSAATDAAYVALLGAPPAPERAVGGAIRPGPGRARVPLGPLAGRSAELDALAGVWAAARAGGLRVVVLEGEAGIGKSRLAAEIATRAAADGAVVLWGRCLASAAAPLQPVSDLLSQLLDTVPDLALPGLPVLAGPAGPSTDQSALPAHSTPSGSSAQSGSSASPGGSGPPGGPGPSGPPAHVAPPAHGDPAYPDAGADLLRQVTRMLLTAGAPALIVIDDVHRATPDAAGLLDRLLRSLATLPCLVVLTTWGTPGPFDEVLGDLPPPSEPTVVAVGGLQVAGVAAMLRHGGVRSPSSDADAETDLATEVRARTAGNPLFVTQLIGEADAEGHLDPAAAPAAVATLVARRMAGLPRPEAATLQLAAIAGPRWSWATIEAASSLGGAALLDVLEELCRQRLLEEVGAGWFGFAHDVVRAAVLAEIGPTRASLLHARLGAALAASGAEAVVVAHHLVAAGPATELDPTPWLLAAGEAALRSGAWTEAARHFGRVGDGTVHPAARCQAAVGQGRAAHGAGDFATARRCLDSAIGLARAAGLAPELASATLALVGGGGRGVAHELGDADREALLRLALDGLDRPGALGPDPDAEPDPERAGIEPSPGIGIGIGIGQGAPWRGSELARLRTTVLGELALSLVLTDRQEECARLCDRAVAEARASGDPDTVARALHTRRSALMGPAGTLRRAADAREAAAIGRVAGTLHARTLVATSLDLVEDLLELADRAGAEEALTAAEAVADSLDHPYWGWATATWRALLAVLDGRLEEGEALAVAAYAHQPGDHPEAVAALQVQLVGIRLLQDRAGEVIDGLRVAAAGAPHIPCYRAVLALCLLRAGRGTDGRQVYDELTSAGFALPADSNWLLGTVVLAECATMLGDADGGAVLVEALRPWTGRQAVLNCYGAGGAWWGPVDHHLDRLNTLCRSRLPQPVTNPPALMRRDDR